MGGAFLDCSKVQFSLGELNNQFIERLKAEHGELNGVRVDSVMYSLIRKISELEAEIIALKQHIQVTTQPKEEPHTTGSSFVLKI